MAGLRARCPRVLADVSDVDAPVRLRPVEVVQTRADHADLSELDVRDHPLDPAGINRLRHREVPVVTELLQRRLRLADGVPAGRQTCRATRLSQIVVKASVVALVDDRGCVLAQRETRVPGSTRSVAHRVCDLDLDRARSTARHRP